MMGFGCKVITYDIKASVAVKEKGIRYMGYDELLQLSDIISIHCLLTSYSHHFFNSIAFGKMKSGAMLINTSRGTVIHTALAVEALKKG